MRSSELSQQEQQRLIDIILANVGTVVRFRSGSPADERVMLPLFSPFIEQGEIANLPAYSYYVRIAAVDACEPMSGMTVVIEDPGSEVVAKTVIESSRQLYARQEKGELVTETRTKIIEVAQSKKLPQAQRSNNQNKRDEELSVLKSVKPQRSPNTRPSTHSAAQEPS